MGTPGPLRAAGDEPTWRLHVPRRTAGCHSTATPSPTPLSTPIPDRIEQTRTDKVLQRRTKLPVLNFGRLTSASRNLLKEVIVQGRLWLDFFAGSGLQPLTSRPSLSISAFGPASWALTIVYSSCDARLEHSSRPRSTRSLVADHSLSPITVRSHTPFPTFSQYPQLCCSLPSLRSSLSALASSPHRRPP